MSLSADPSGSVPPAAGLGLVPIVARVVTTAQRLWAPAQRRLGPMCLAGVLGGAGMVGVTFCLTPVYHSTMTLTVDGQAKGVQLPGHLAALGAQFGLSAGGDDSKSHEFYQWLAGSDDVLSAILRDTVPTALRGPYGGDSPTGGATVFAQVLDEPLPTDPVRFAKGLVRFRKRVDIGISPTVGTLSVTVGAPTRPLAMWLATRHYQEIDRANRERRQTRASVEAAYLTTQVADAARALADAEGALAAFTKANRHFQLSPRLTFAEERLRQQVTLTRETHLGLVKGLQDAETRAMRDVPTLSVMDGPTFAPKRARPRRLLMGAVAALLATLLVYVIGLYRDELAVAGHAPRRDDTFDRALRDFVG